MTAAPDTLQQRYEAIEQVYSECQWDDVARQSEALLVELPNDPDHPLRQRLQILLGHTYLYGYQDAATASGFYSRVQAATAEPVLREIAEQGLQLCASQAATSLPQEPAPAEATPLASGGEAIPLSAEAGPAMPWMEQLGGPDAAVAPAETAQAQPLFGAEAPGYATPVPELVADVLDEPELIELAQADPAQAEELEIAVSEQLPATVQENQIEPISRLSPEEMAEFSKGLLRVVIR